MERPRNYADPAKTTYIPAGPLTFGIEYRHLQTDQGICIHVFGDLNGKEEEFLRFDCFERTPHYHYAWSTDDEYVALDTTAEGDPLQWTLERLRTRLFLDVFNITNSSASETITRTTGANYLRPAAILAPVTARVGFRFLG